RDDARETRRGQRRADPLIGRYERVHGNAQPLDEPQVMAWEIAIEQIHRCGEVDDAGLAELLELKRCELRQRHDLRELQLPLICVERVLSELRDVLQQPRRPRQPAAIGTPRGGASVARRGWRPVVVLDVTAGVSWRSNASWLCASFAVDVACR